MSFSDKFVKRFVGNIFPDLRKTHLVNLSLGVYGQIKSQSGLMSEIVREVPGADKHKHRLKRFWRFLSNPRIKPERLQEYWVCWCIKIFATDTIIKVAMDWTTLPGNIQCLMIALPLNGRSIPLFWQCVIYRDIKDSQNMIEERLFARLSSLVREFAPAKKLLLTADRGFGRATLFQFLQKKNILFVIRVKGDVTITIRHGKKLILRKLGKTLKLDTPVWYEAITYRSDGKVTGVNLAAIVAEPKEEGADIDPWFLITNLTDKETAIKRYEERFHIEEWFKDMKHQLGIANIQTKSPMRIRRLLFLACVSYGILMITGTAIDSQSEVMDKLITGGRKVASTIWFALKVIKYHLMGGDFWKSVQVAGLGP